MKRNALLTGTAAALLLVAAGAGHAADTGTVKSLSDLDTGLGDFQYIYPHADYDSLPPNAYTKVSPVRPASNAVPVPQQVDVPIDRADTSRDGVTSTDATRPR